jgi:hypothetical protein
MTPISRDEFDRRLADVLAKAVQHNDTAIEAYSTIVARKVVNELDARFGRRANALENRIGTLENRLSALEQWAARFEQSTIQRFTVLETRVEVVEHKVDRALTLLEAIATHLGLTEI